MWIYEYSVQGPRPEHEDVHHVLRHPSGWWLLFVCDGHGGTLVAHQIASLFPFLAWTALDAKVEAKVDAEAEAEAEEEAGARPDDAWMQAAAGRLKDAVLRLDRLIYEASGYASAKTSAKTNVPSDKNGQVQGEEAKEEQEREEKEEEEAESMPSLLDMVAEFQKSKKAGAGSAMQWTGADESGSTLAAWLWHPDWRCGFAVHVGDSRVALVRPGGGGVLFMTRDHGLEDKQEYAHVAAFEGAVDGAGSDDPKQMRVVSEDGTMSLAMTRSIGDFAFKREKGVYSGTLSRVRAVADVRPFRFAADQPLALDVVVACDGLWDVTAVDAKQQASFRVPGGKQPARELAEAALRKGSQDNVTVLVMRIRPESSELSETSETSDGAGAGAGAKQSRKGGWMERWAMRVDARLK